MKWLITGGCGFIGRALASELLAIGGQRVRVLDNLSVGTRADLKTVSAFSELPLNTLDREWAAPLALCEANILDYEAVSSALVGAHVVVHLAANTGVGPSVEDPFADCQANVTGTLNMLEACRHAGKRPGKVGLLVGQDRTAERGVGIQAAVGADGHCADLRPNGIKDMGNHGSPREGDEPLVLTSHAGGSAAGEDNGINALAHGLNLLPPRGR